MNKDKNINTIECKRCGADLIDILVIDKEADVDFTFVAHCGYCKGESEEHHFHGLLQQDGTELSDVIDIVPDENTGIVHFYTQKVTRVK